MTMHFAVTILGNNSALPAHGRMPTAQVVTFQDRLYLVDCGEGTQMQMSRYKVRSSKIRHIFISHMHGDHYFGLIGLINSFNLLKRPHPLYIYGPPELEAILQLQLDGGFDQLAFELHFIPLTPDKTGVILEEDELEVSCFSTRHRIPCFGFLFRQVKHKRKINTGEAEAHHIPVTFYPQLQRGADYPGNGGVVKNEWVTEDPPPGKSYAFCADTRYDESMIPFIRHCDLIYHETTFLKEQAERAEERYHSTTVQAAALAKKAEVKKLLIGHFSSKYELLDPFLEESAAVFPHTELALEGVTYFV